MSATTAPKPDAGPTAVLEPPTFAPLLGRRKDERAIVVDRCHAVFFACDIEGCVRKLRAVLIAHEAGVGGPEAVVYLLDDALKAARTLERKTVERAAEIGLLNPMP